MAEYGKRERDKPWIMRTYSGHSTATASNELYRTNLAKGQTGLSVAFDLPTQTGYDADDPLARGEVGKVGVPVSHLGDMRALFDGLPLDQMNTSMTINATAVWLLSLYIATAEDQGVDHHVLRGTTQNDIIKEYLSRGTHIFPPAASMRLITDLITYTVDEVPKWNPINICSYHLQEAGATPTQELAYALVTAIGVLDAVKATGRVPDNEFGKVVGRMSFFVNAGIRFVEELCKMRAFVELWDRVARERYGVTDPKQRRFRYGIQVNSLGLTEQQPENNVIRIVLEMLAVTLSKDARARAIQLPAWNEALGLPRPWDQQWSLRAQQILAYETDLLEYDDLFNGSPVVQAKTQQLVDSAWAEVQEVLKRGGAVEAVETGYIKQRLVESNAARLRAIEAGEQVVVGVNKYIEGADSPLIENLDDAILTVDPEVDTRQRAALARWKEARNGAAAETALAEIERVAKTDENLMGASIAAAHAGVTTGEWANALRQVWGEYRAPTGVAGATVKASRSGAAAETINRLRKRLDALEARMGRRAKLLVGKPGLDGHSNGAEQIAIKARDVGFDVVYEGIRVSPEQIVASALEEGVHLIGLSILSGSHLALVPEVVQRLRDAGLGDIPVVAGGIIPEADAERLRAEGVAAVYTPKDFELDNIMSDLIDLVDHQNAAE
ncbi:MAG: protein meaA [Deltaproteobacteria bacterium]|nr:protein meaA [Deltaproteobacteria bacterium]